MGLSFSDSIASNRDLFHTIASNSETTAGPESNYGRFIDSLTIPLGTSIFSSFKASIVDYNTYLEQ